MKHSIFATVAVAAAAAMISLSPALAGNNDHYRHNHNKPHHADRGHYGNSYGNHWNGHKHWNQKKYYGHRHWKKRFYGWNYDYRPYRGW